MQKFKPEFGNREHISLIEEEERKQRISEIIEEFPDDFVAREEYDKLKNVFGDAFSNVFKSLRDINKINEKSEELQDYVEELISELDSIYP